MSRPRSPRKARKPTPPRDPRSRARDEALRLLAGRDLSRKELHEALLARRHTPAEVEAVLASLTELGLADDRRAARTHVSRRLAGGPVARALLESELESRGIDAGAAAEAIGEAFGTADDGGRALQVARETVRTAPARLAPASVLRRAFALLLRRGFDEETARQAVESAGEEYLGRP
jgi:SOS response regulatory protein OraA/RecX